MAEPIDPRVTIGHVHLKVADLERALAFYSGVLGFELTHADGTVGSLPERRRLSPSHRPQHLGEPRRLAAAAGRDRVSITSRFATRTARRLADALRRLVDAGVPLDGASDHGVSEALYLRDPDGNGIELYWDRPREQWPRAADGALRMTTDRLDVEALLAEARQGRARRDARPSAAPADAGRCRAPRANA